MPVITQIADAVVATLQCRVIEPADHSHAQYLPRAEVADLKTLKVTVVPSSVVNASPRGLSLSRMWPSTWPSKEAWQRTERLVRSAARLAEEIGDLFRAKRLESFPLAACIKTEFKTIYAPEHIENLRTFTSVLTLTFSRGHMTL